MRVLSLFDGMSCGQVALQRVGIKIEEYVASEIDSPAMFVAQKNFPNIRHVGDVRALNASKFGDFDLLLGGPPCQSFSKLGKRTNFSDPRGQLLFEYQRILEEVQPKYFLLENVGMKKEWEDKVSEMLGVKPIVINSNLVSAQNRKRLYWTNLNIKLPEDELVELSDIEDVFGTSPVTIVDPNKYGIGKYVYYTEDVPMCFTERRTEEAKKIRKEYREKHGKDFCPRRAKEMVPRTDKKANCLTTSLTREHTMLDSELRFRMLTVTECERLQTLDDGYTEGVPDSQRLKMIGNGWTVDVIKHILSYMPR